MEDKWDCNHAWFKKDPHFHECIFCNQKREIFPDYSCTNEEFKKLFPNLDMNK